MNLVFAVTGYTAPMAAGECRPRQSAIRSQPSTMETANFRIYGIGRLPNARGIGDSFETLRSLLSRTWLGERVLADWSPKCDVVVHPTVASYTRAVGQDQFATLGSSRVDTMGGRITLRRLDIRADQTGWFAAAVPHELTHVIMADEFRAGQLPAWADEGMAVLADTPAKQALHLRDFNTGRRSGSTLRLVSFVGASGYPSPENIPVFYGQSVSLVKYLVERRSPADFVRFLHRVDEVGCDTALAEVYGFCGVADLERQWRTATSATTENIRTVLASPGAAVSQAS
ncbi:MAG: peptidase MA family metallohydrolase [Pirellulales bacterium]